VGHRPSAHPNALTVGVAASGVAVALAAGGPHAALASAGAAALVVAVLWIPWGKGAIGGGDLKLAGGTAAWVGLAALPRFALVSLVAVGVLAVACYLLSEREARAEIRANLRHASSAWARVRSWRRPGACRPWPAWRSLSARSRPCFHEVKRCAGGTSWVRRAREFAIVLPLLLFIVLGGIDWGHYFMVEQIAVNAAREGARVGSLHAPDAPDAAMLAEAETTASAYLSRAGLDVTRASVSAVPGVGSVVVHVSYQTGSVTGFLDLGPLMPTSANATAEMRR
jgi:hypothetical protein